MIRTPWSQAEVSWQWTNDEINIINPYLMSLKQIHENIQLEVKKMLNENPYLEDVERDCLKQI